MVVLVNVVGLEVAVEAVVPLVSMTSPLVTTLSSLEAAVVEAVDL